MSSEHGLWKVRIKKPAQKNLKRAPRHEREGLVRVLEDMLRDPFAGDTTPLANEQTAYRRRFGGWRIFFDTYPAQRTVEITNIIRRTTTTYRKR